jgi:hypothetical protein
MFKWVSWALRVGATALLLSFLCIWTTGYIVNSYMETVIKQLDLPLETQPLALSGMWGTLWGANKSPDTTNQPSNEAVSTSEASPSPSQSPEKIGESSASPSEEVGSVANESANNETPPGIKDPVAQDGDPSNAIPVFNAGAGSEAGAGQTTSQLTDAQRQNLYALVVSKLDPEQLKLLSDALQGGLTADELSSLQSMLKTALSDDEYTQMMALLQGSENTASVLPNG